MMDYQNIEKDKKSKSNGRAELYRQSRKWHGYLSALAFLALIFFSVTGIMLNHPEWFSAEPGQSRQYEVVLPADLLVTALTTEDPPRTIAEIAGTSTPLVGAYSSGEIMDGSAMIRFEGTRGSSDLSIDLQTGRTEVAISQASASTILQELHRGTSAGIVWRLLLDVTAALIILLSIIGYVLFFSLRFKLRTSLVLTGASLTVMTGVFFAFVY